MWIIVGVWKWFVLIILKICLVGGLRQNRCFWDLDSSRSPVRAMTPLFLHFTQQIPIQAIWHSPRFYSISLWERPRSRSGQERAAMVVALPIPPPSSGLYSQHPDFFPCLPPFPHEALNVYWHSSSRHPEGPHKTSFWKARDMRELRGRGARTSTWTSAVQCCQSCLLPARRSW